MPLVPEPTQIRTTLDAILLLMIQQLATYTDVDASRILIVAAETEDVPHFTADNDILLRPSDERRVHGYLEGAGRVDDRRTRDIHVYCRSRMFLDTADSDFSRLTDASRGHFALEDDVCNALQEWFPTDVNQNLLTYEPVVVEGPTSPRKDRGDPNWVSSYFTVTLDYRRDLDQTRQ